MTNTSITTSRGGCGIVVLMSRHRPMQDYCPATDEEHIAFALREGRVIFTNDPDFLVLDGQGVEHAGIAYCGSEARSIGHIVRYLCLMHDCMTPEEMRGRVEYV